MGPNGSGKSNVIDAMLFVFGYRSKMIRTKKVSQLIHNSENHQNVQSCTVAVHFQKIIDLVSAVLTDVTFCLDTRRPGTVFKKLDTRQSEILTNFLEIARLIPLRT